MLTERDYCDYETCVALRELGFTLDMTEKVYERNLMTNRYETTPKPLLYEAHKWLREEKHIDLAVYSGKGKDTDRIWVCNLVMEKTVRQLTHEGIVVKTFSSYEEALSEGIKEAIKNLSIC